jgi:demethylmenaquinone methyltransferase/2-methoxy-6-polyprenyl-1,4-benzoquinol methylase
VTMSRSSKSSKLRELDLERDLDELATKRRYVRTLFDTVETSYDRFTRLFSFGMDGRWKQRLVRLVGESGPPVGRVLDLATGTGDIAKAVSERWPETTVVGLDLSLAMLRRTTFGRPRDKSLRSAGDMMALPHPSGGFSVVTAGYGFRNSPDCSKSLTEVHRVLPVGGRLASLDFYLPENPAWRVLFVEYLRITGRVAGRLAHGVPEAYGYIAASLERWMTASEFSRLLAEFGFEVEIERRMLLGGIAIHVARKR